MDSTVKADLATDQPVVSETIAPVTEKENVPLTLSWENIIVEKPGELFKQKGCNFFKKTAPKQIVKNGKLGMEIKHKKLNFYLLIK
jgi:hypothetical protein